MGFVRAFRSGAGSHPGLSPSDSLAETIEESTHVRGLHGGLPRAGTEQQHEIVVQGHEDYQKSFKKGTS